MLGSVRGMGLMALLLVIAFNSVGNLFLRIGALAPPSRFAFGIIAWQSLLGAACFACSIVAYAWALRTTPLHVAQVVVSAQYVATIALAATILAEPVSPSKWLGIALIAAGIYVCTR